MAVDGTIRFSTKLDNTELEKDLKQAERKIDSLKDKIIGEEAKKTVYEKLMQEANKAMDETGAKIRTLAAEYDALQAKFESANSVTDKENIANSMVGIMAQLSALEGSHSRASAQLERYDDQWHKADESLQIFTAQLERAQMKQNSLAAEAAGAYTGVVGKYRTKWDAFQSRMKATAKATVEKIKASHQKGAAAITGAYSHAGAALKNAFKNVFSVVGIVAAFRALSQKVKEFVLQNEQAKVSMNGLKAACAGFAGGIASIAMPAIIGFIRVVTTMVMTLARLVDSLFKTDFVGRIREQVAAFNASASSSSDAAKATDKQAEATDRLAKATKEANRQLMSFDELNVLNADQEEDNSSGLNDIAEDLGADSGAGFDSATLLDTIDETLATIMMIAGAAILAVGIILAVSGANIPLGLALIAIGALMMYTAATEMWDKLPADIQNTISLIMALIAGALIVIGVILCSTGNLPLGIAFIIAGAALFVVDATINPEFISGMIQEMHNHILGIVAGALIVLGVILVAVGHPLIGIAFIIAGAVLFVGEVVLNWEQMPTAVQEFLMGMISIIAGALIVLGVILCAVGHPVLGIAAIIAGIGIFVVAAVLDDNATPNKIRMFLSQMIPIIGKALIVVGVLLCVVGNLPLGIAAIIFGIVLWVVGEAITEGVPAQKIMDFLQTMLPEIGKALVVIGVLLCVVGNLPLGIAAIIFGVTIWVVGEILNENLTKEKIESFISNVLPVIAGAMIVLGIILCATGVALPIGIGLIVAGIGALVFSQVNLDWDFILNKIKEIWGNIKQWWNDNVAHVFTVEFWQGIFKSIADGIWSAITSIGDTISGFFNGIGEGIGGILGGLGESFSWVVPSFNFPAPQLASGAVIPPNKRFMAVLGDQTNGRNLEAPEGLIRQIVREESGVGNSQLVDILQDLLRTVQEGKAIYIDGEPVFQTMRPYMSTYERMGF